MTALSEPRIAAVLFLVYPRDGIPHIAFTQRTETVGSHRGQISLPGGRRDPTDASLEHTALREAYEEIGIDPGLVQVWGRLDDVYVRVSNHLIAPYVGAVAEEPRFEVNSAEVAQVIEVPVAVLRDPAVYREEVWRLGGEMREIQIYQHGPHVIWGATARAVELFLESPFAERALGWGAPVHGRPASGRMEPSTTDRRGSHGG